MYRRTASQTRAMAIAGAGSTAAGSTSLGNLTLPAQGPWNILYAWGFVCQATLAAAELAGGDIIFTPSSGDVDPNMQPTKIPTSYQGSLLGATAPVQQSQLVLFPLDLQAAGKAVINVAFDQQIAITTANQVVAGLIFGKDVKDAEIPTNYETIDGTLTSAALTSLGTITIPESATRLVGVVGQIAQDGVLTAGEELLGFFSLSSDDVKLVPCQFPFSAAYSAGLGATIGNTKGSDPVFIPLDIEVPGGARVDVNIDLNTAVTNAAGAKVTLAFR